MSTATSSPSIVLLPTGSLPAAPVAGTTPNAPQSSVPRLVSVLRQDAASQPYRLTVEQFEQMVSSGILTEQDRCELIRGELIEKMTIGDPHAAAVNRLTRCFKRISDDEALLSTQNPIKLRDSRPEPDFVLLVPRDDFYASQTPGPPDILLLIEVADSSLEFDRKIKLPLYAENSIQEYWIINLIDDCIEVHRQPQGLEYQHRQVIQRGQSMSPLALPAVVLAAEAVLGPAPAAESAG